MLPIWMRVVGVLLAILSFARALDAERLPVRVYSTLDGLPGIAIHRIVRDSHGFLWFCTGEGLSRFDGYGFKNYGSADGLAEPNVNDLIETPEGIYWVATAVGLWKFDPQLRSGSTPTAPKFEVVHAPGGGSADWINVLLQDPSGAIWAGTQGGLFRFQASGHRRFQFVDLGAPDKRPMDRSVFALCQDRKGQLWIGTGSGLYLRRPDGGIERFTEKDDLPSDHVFSLTEDSQGRIWVGTLGGLAQLAGALDRRVHRVYTTGEGLPSNGVVVLFETSNGSIWAGTREGLAINPAGSQPNSLPFRAYTSHHGLSDENIQTLAEDRAGNLWIGTDSGGAVKVANGGFITYGAEDGLGSGRVVSMFEDRTGELCIVTKAPGRLFINRFDGRRFTAIRLNVPSSYYGPDWLGWYQVALESRRREWWVASVAGLLWFPAAKDRFRLATMTPGRRYDTRDGLTGNHIHQVFEDSRGNLWISTRDPEGNGITRWDAASKSFYCFSERDGLPSLKSVRANGFFEDRARRIWIGLRRKGVMRYADGRFRVFSDADGVPAGGIRRIYQDQRGRLWMGSGAGGIARVDNPEAERPTFVRYGTSEGLSGNEIQAITEDQWGRIYVGTGHGVDRLDPATGRVHHYTTADGLAPGEVQTAHRDRDGVLWFGTVQGVSSLIPSEDHPQKAPPVRVMSLQVAGDPYPMADNGVTDLAMPDLPAQRDHFKADFLGLSFAPGEVLRYQYRLEDVDQDWSRETTVRSVIYRNLAPGKYRFQVRALNSDGVTSPHPASVSFRILPPFWMRWWFLGLATIVAGSAIYAFVRFRIRQLLELERVRIRIATDLHDDIGAGLSQIAIVSEVARRRDNSSVEWRDTLAEIAGTSSELIDSMSDIVWAIDPEKDNVSDLSQRMRQFASEICTARGIDFRLQVQDSLDDFVARVDVRRQVLLIFKEAINNLVRHSGCTEAQAELEVRGGYLFLTVADKGKGFDASQVQRGHGLKSMTDRVCELGGELRISSLPSAGTTLTLKVPLQPATRWRRILHKHAGTAGSRSG